MSSVLAEEYARAYKMSRQRKDESAEISRRIKLIEREIRRCGGKHRSLMDAGCGRGLLVAALQNRYVCLGIDKDENAIRDASRVAKKAGFFVADMRSIGTDRKFDIITCFDAIDHGDEMSKDIGKTLKGFYRTLNKKGLLIFSAPLSLETWEHRHSSATSFTHKGKRWIYLYQKHIGTDGSFCLDKVIISIKGDKVEHEFQNASWRFEQPLLKVSGIADLAKRAGFKVRIYDGLSNRRWPSLSTEEPVFVCINV